MSAAKAKGAVGIVGLGIMGGAFAKNLATAGWRVVGYDIDPARCRAMAKLGVEIAKNAGALAAKVPILITSLPNAKALDLTVKSIVDARLPRRIMLEASTFTLADKEKAERALRKSGHIMLDAPVSGTGSQAQTKDLVFYASGDTKSIAKLKPLFAGFGRKVYDVGKFGNGSKMKYVANLLVAINNVASAEAMVLGMKAGLDPRMIFEMVSNGAGNSRVFELRAPMMVQGRYDEPTMKVSVWQKDMQVIGDFARQIGCPTPMFSATLPVYVAAMKSGHGDEDTAAVCAVLESMARFKRKRRSSPRAKL
jgi:3-hydroxyisobutyrate dehydrogenase-like beta-hydroxyacid dehydrogenase